MKLDNSSQSRLSNQISCSIIGGGMAGLVAGNVLQQHGFDVAILDKGRGIGGRMATRRIPHADYGEGIFDYGVQYITAQSEEFKKWLDEWLAIGLVERWDCASRSSEELESLKYRGVQSIRSIAKHLSSNLKIHTGVRIVELSWREAGWMITADDGKSYDSNLLILTPPLPQMLQLLKDSQIPISTTSLERLSRVTYRMCLTVLAIASGPLHIQQSGSCHVNGDQLEWIACNRLKGISPDCYAVTLQANAEFSEQHYAQAKREAAAQALIQAAKQYFGDSSIIEYQVHVWRYSTPINHFDGTFFSLQNCSIDSTAVGPLYIAGDAFSSGNENLSSLENAFLSGFEVAMDICQKPKAT